MPSSMFRLFTSLALVLVAAGGRASGQDLTTTMPAPVDVELTTKDGVKLLATYLPSKKGKDAVAVIALHMFKGNRRDMLGLGQFLQKQGHAVIMPDLRGHGESTSVTINGVERKFDAATMPPVQFQNMVQYDMEAVKKFLLGENNAGKLNIERLCVIGAEMSCQIAVKWTAVDWSWPVLPSLKQGQDVKAVILLSPTTAFKTLNMSQEMTSAQSPMREKISILMVCGAEDKQSATDAKRFEQTLARFRPKPEKIEDKTLFLEASLETKLVGTKLLGEASLGVEDLIGQFIELRLVAPTYPWKDRTTP